MKKILVAFWYVADAVFKLLVLATYGFIIFKLLE